MRKGVLLGIIAGVLGIGALFLNFVSGSIFGETIALSINSCKSEQMLGTEGNEVYSIFFNVFVVMSIGIALFSYLSNRKNLLGILTLILSLGHFGFSFLIYSTGKEAFKSDNPADLSFGLGMYVLLISGILAIIGAVLAIMKK